MHEELNQTSAKPSPYLSAYIDRFWGWAQTQACVFPQMLPGTGAECIFNYGDPLRIVDITHDKAVLAPQAFLLCNRQHVLRFEATGQVDFISVRFRAGQLRHFTRAPLLDIQNRVVAAGDLWPQCTSVVEQMAKAKDFSRRVAKLELFLTSQFQLPSAILLDRLINTLYYAPSSRIERLARALSCSRRTLDRRFFEAFGLSPKRFTRLARMHKVARKLALASPGRLIDFILDAGFFDQSHFYHDFFDLTGLSPSEFSAQQQGISTFYHQAHDKNSPVIIRL